jgi:hypothetical protein
MDLSTLIGDVQFQSTRVDSSTYTVKLHDHSRLGGPMGSETTSVIESWTFANFGVAKSFAEKLIERLALHDSRIDAESNIATLMTRAAHKVSAPSYEVLVDLLSVGVSIGKKQGDVIIQGFTYERPTVERVAA